jgi:hypothetical protein
MADAAAQVHHQFKVFTAPGADLTALASDVEEFVRARNLAAKSIGVEYLEGADRLVFTVGYRDDEAGYPVRITWQSLGVVDSLDDLSPVEGRMAQAASSLAGVLCHELFVTGSGEFVMVFMAAA